jgi:hypothetical protein
MQEVVDIVSKFGGTDHAKSTGQIDVGIWNHYATD